MEQTSRVHDVDIKINLKYVKKCKSQAETLWYVEKNLNLQVSKISS